jgi:hypothetical protein
MRRRELGVLTILSLVRVVGASTGATLEAAEGVCNVARHSDVNSGAHVIPFDCHAGAQGAGPVSGDFVEFFQGGEKVFGIGTISVFDPKGIDNQT